MPSGAEGFDTNGRPDDLLKRITYNANNYGKGAFLFADADAGPEDNRGRDAIASPSERTSSWSRSCTRPWRGRRTRW